MLFRYASQVVRCRISDCLMGCLFLFYVDGELLVNAKWTISTFIRGTRHDTDFIDRSSVVDVQFIAHENIETTCTCPHHCTIKETVVHIRVCAG